jgi:hypothetical protein
VRRTVSKQCEGCHTDKFMAEEDRVCSSCKEKVKNNRCMVVTAFGVVVRKNTRPNPTRKLGPSYLTGKKKPSGYTRSSPRRVINPRFLGGRSSPTLVGNLDSPIDA